MIVFSPFTQVFVSDKKRPGGHLNLGVLANIVADIIVKQPLTLSERHLLDTLDTKDRCDADKIARKMKATNFLSTYGYAVCHKIPYAAFEKSLIVLLNGNPPPNKLAWHRLESLLQQLHGIG